MEKKSFLSEYFRFSRNDRIAVILLTTLIFLVFLLPLIPGLRKGTPEPVTDTAWISALQQLEENSQPENEGPGKNSYEGRSTSRDPIKEADERSSPAEYFYFDPNSLSPEGWKKLGLPERTIRTIQHYLSKGGRFRKSSDLEKIYGLKKNDFDRLEPYVRILAPDQNNRPDHTRDLRETTKPQKTVMMAVDINLADTSAFIALPGIGSKLANRIVNFREKLGGFYSISQISEVFGLPDSTFQKIKPLLKLERAEIRKININTATLEELKAHPYIRFSLAGPIIAYRKEHGPFRDPESLKNIMVITPEIFLKLAPYISAE